MASGGPSQCFEDVDSLLGLASGLLGVLAKCVHGVEVDTKQLGSLLKSDQSVAYIDLGVNFKLVAAGGEEGYC